MTDPRPSNESELVDYLRAIDVRAPDSLHARVEALIASESSRRGRRGRRDHRRDGSAAARSFSAGPRLAGAGAIVAALAIIAIAVGLSGGGNSSAPSVSQASALTLREATAAAPAESSRNHAELAATVDGVSFPYWGGSFGWRSTGVRTDHVAGRTITTVFYANRRGQRVGYAIVSGTAPKHHGGGRATWRDGSPYWLFSQNGVKVVTWLRDGHLCVVSGRGVSGATLLHLASWDNHDAIAS
jgi:hypothetical protein